jgi:hypothetical protein
MRRYWIFAFFCLLGAYVSFALHVNVSSGDHKLILSNGGVRHLVFSQPPPAGVARPSLMTIVNWEFAPQSLRQPLDHLFPKIYTSASAGYVIGFPLAATLLLGVIICSSIAMYKVKHKQATSSTANDKT